MQILWVVILCLLPGIAFAEPGSIVLKSDGFRDDAQVIWKSYKEATLKVPDVQSPSSFTQARWLWAGLTVAATYSSIAVKPSRLSPDETSKYLQPTHRLPNSIFFIRDLANLVTVEATTDIEKIVMIHNFILWRVTHSALFDNGQDEAALSSEKGKLRRCLLLNYMDVGRRKKACGIDLGDDILFDNTLITAYLGIHNCIGYASLFLDLARAVGISARMVSEKKAGPRHFWNQVFLRGQWLVVDTTYDDKYDQGFDQSETFLNFDYLLVSSEKAGEQDPETHKNYQIELE